MREPLDGACPNCKAQIVLYDWGFECSICSYDHKQWAAFLTSGHSPLDIVAAALAKYPMHVDSPALHVSKMSPEERAAALEEASLRG